MLDLEDFRRDVREFFGVIWWLLRPSLPGISGWWVRRFGVSEVVS